MKILIGLASVLASAVIITLLLKRRRRKTWPVWAAGLVWLAVLLALIYFGSQSASALAKVTLASFCQPATPGADQALATVTARANPSINIPFGRDFGVRQRSLEYETEDPSSLLNGGTCLGVEVSQFIRDTGDAELNPSGITAATRLEPGRLVLTVGVDRSGNSLGPAGTYTGVVSIIDPRVQRVDVPVTVTMAYPVWQYPLAVFVAALLPATIYLWLLRGSFTKGGTSGQLKLEDFEDYFASRNGLLSLGTGTVAAFGIFMVTYLSAAEWRGDTTQFLTLAGAMFTAFTTAGTAVSAAGVDTP